MSPTQVQKRCSRKVGISVSRSLLSGALSTVDKMMEETFMKFAKSAGGFSGIFLMFGAYEGWCGTTSTRAQYHKKLLEMCGLVDDLDSPEKRKHRKLEKAEVEKSEKALIRLMTAIRKFTSPFEVADKWKLCNLASGASVPPNVDIDVMQAEIKGKSQKDDFILVRLNSGHSTDLFFESIPRLKLGTMAACTLIEK